MKDMDDLISRQEAIDALDVLCQEHRYKMPGKGETYSQYNEAWQDALDRAEGAIFNLPPAEPKRGKWIYHIDDLFPAESTMECNQCHAEQPLICDDEFCPKCGAKMEGTE
jgi:hypothetical protein